MFNKKEMKLVNFEKAKKYLMEGVQVYMVNLDGSLVELNEDTDWKSILFHNLKGGSYAVYRRKHKGIGEFHKEIHIGALVDAVLNVGGLSSKFTQDIEDMDLSQEQVGKSPDELKSQAKTPRPATKKQIQYLQQLMQQHGNTAEAMNKYVKQAYGIDDYNKITGLQASELIEKYKSLEK